MKPEPIYPTGEMCGNCPVGHGGCICLRVPMYRLRAERGRPDDFEAIRKASGQAPPPGPPPPGRRDLITPEQAAAARHQARLAKAAKACPDRVPEPGCGCSGRATCKRDGASKTRQQCWACVEAAGPVEIG
jgi:hypothetical protein